MKAKGRSWSILAGCGWCGGYWPRDSCRNGRLRQTGVSRVVIAGIASGKRPDEVARRAARQAAREAVEPVGPPERCPGCGGRVFMPCLLCHVRAVKPTIAKSEDRDLAQPSSGAGASPRRSQRDTPGYSLLGSARQQRTHF